MLWAALSPIKLRHTISHHSLKPRVLYSQSLIDIRRNRTNIMVTTPPMFQVLCWQIPCVCSINSQPVAWRGWTVQTGSYEEERTPLLRTTSLWVAMTQEGTTLKPDAALMFWSWAQEDLFVCVGHGSGISSPFAASQIWCCAVTCNQCTPARGGWLWRSLHGLQRRERGTPGPGATSLVFETFLRGPSVSASRRNFPALFLSWFSPFILSSSAFPYLLGN